ncbi:MAG TPA: cytochrome c-type biogenesis protein [Steroidobacteraceae bacterium]|nr:cytochrome c-type biogenesis protein [Steroidobacteraceae bacterium]
MIRSILLLCLAAFVVPALAIDTEPPLSDPKLQARYERLGKELRCLVCQNQAIGDSNAGLAQDLRRELRELLEAGKTDQEIEQFMTERYGDFVLYKPPVAPRTWLLWAAPGVLLLLGLAAVVAVVRRRASLPVDDESPETKSDPA